MTATVRPRSSFTSSSGSAHRAAARGRPRPSADSEQATSGTAKATSWKSNPTADAIPQDSPQPRPTVHPATGPSARSAQPASGTTATASSAAWASSSTYGDGQIR